MAPKSAARRHAQQHLSRATTCTVSDNGHDIELQYVHELFEYSVIYIENTPYSVGSARFTSSKCNLGVCKLFVHVGVELPARSRRTRWHLASNIFEVI